MGLILERAIRVTSEKAPCPYSEEMRWDWIDEAIEYAKRSLCDRSKVGAALILADGDKFLAHNQVTPGHGSITCKSFCPRGAKTFAEQPAYAEYNDCSALHAEFAVVNKALFAAGRNNSAEAFGEMADGLKTSQSTLRQLFRNSWMFVTREPCDACKMYLEGLGIRYQWVNIRKRKRVIHVSDL